MYVLSLVPCDDIRDSNLVHAREEGECCEDEWGDDEFVLIEGCKKTLLVFFWLEDSQYVPGLKGKQAQSRCFTFCDFLSSISAPGVATEPLLSLPATGPRLRTSAPPYVAPDACTVAIIARSSVARVVECRLRVEKVRRM